MRTIPQTRGRQKNKEKQYEADKKTDQRGAELNRTQHQEENKNKREHGGKKAKNIKGANAATRQVCELQRERGGQTTPTSLDEPMRPPESKILRGFQFMGV